MVGTVARWSDGTRKIGFSHRFWYFRTLPLAGLLGVSISAGPSPAQAQSDLFSEDETEEFRLRKELEEAWESQVTLAEHRALAHSRLEADASWGPQQAVCPVSGAASAPKGSHRERISALPSPRYAARPHLDPWRGVAPAGESPAGIFNDYISGQVVQSKCIYCHVEGGVSGHTRLVLRPSSDDSHEAANLEVFRGFLESVEGGADLILNKVQGAESHGGGVQLVPGSADFANMERFLRALGGSTTSAGLSPEALFDGVTMASPTRILRRAALLFAGRLPTPAELEAVRAGSDASLRKAIRGLMEGPGFHDFLIRSANDRLLTDRERPSVLGGGVTKFVNFANKRYELAQQALAEGHEYPRRSPLYRHYERAIHYGMARAPLELIAHVVENDLPYTEILTADYIMANPMAADAYGADTEFDNPSSAVEFQPSRIVGYYRGHRTQVVEEDPLLGRRVVDPGILSTEYPHAGILNTTVFLKRYPTTATNRNRARSRWTYYHFLGVDIEKSAARTTDPDALADTNNPTLNNPACTVCHIPMDPVAGTFQNYGDMGLYRNKSGGMDSLPTLYKYPTDGSVSPYRRGDTWFRDMREPGFNGQVAPSADTSLQWLAEEIVKDERFATAVVKFWWPAIMGVDLEEPPAESTDSGFEARRLAAAAQNLEIAALADAFRAGIDGGDPWNLKDLLVEIALSPWFRAESVVGEDGTRAEALRDAGVDRLLSPEELARKTEAITGYVWGRRFSQPFGTGEARSRLHDPQGFSGYQLLYGGIDSDGIEARTGDMTPLMAAVAQSHAVEVSCPIVRREFYYWPEGGRLLFDGISSADTPHSDIAREFDVLAESYETRQLLQWDVELGAGAKNVRLAYTNNRIEASGDGSTEGLDRNLSLDRMVIRGDDSTILEVELESFARQGCGRARGEVYRMVSNCSLDVPVELPTAGLYRIVVVAYQDRAGDQAARLAVEVGSPDGSGSGAAAIRRKLADLHRKLYGVSVAVDSPDVEEAFSLFVEIWNRKRATEGPSFFASRTQCNLSADHLYFEGVLSDVLEYQPGGASRLESARIRELDRATDFDDRNHTIRTWAVTLAYLLTDYRYLYF